MKINIFSVVGQSLTSQSHLLERVIVFTYTSRWGRLNSRNFYSKFRIIQLTLSTAEQKHALEETKDINNADYIYILEFGLSPH